MSYKGKNYLTIAIALGVFGEFVLLGCIFAASAQGAEISSGQNVSPSAIRAQQAPLNLVSYSPLVALGQTLGEVVIYDDPKTPRPADYLELYDTGADLVAIAWFDRFGIQRMALDRALVEGGNELQGVLVTVLDGEAI